jgi:hypothetical protein
MSNPIEDSLGTARTTTPQPNNTANIMKNLTPQTAPAPAPAHSLAHCPTWFVVVLYLTSFGMVFYILLQIYTSLEIL